MGNVCSRGIWNILLSGAWLHFLLSAITMSSLLCPTDTDVKTLGIPRQKVDTALYLWFKLPSATVLLFDLQEASASMLLPWHKLDRTANTID